MAHVSLRNPAGGFRLDCRDVGGGLARRRFRQTAQARLPSLYHQRDRRSRPRLSAAACGRSPPAIFPGGLVADRTALEQQPAPGRLGVSRRAEAREVALPAVTLRGTTRARQQPDDFKLRDDLYCMSTARALLENMRPTRARSGAASTLKRSEIEAWLDRIPPQQRQRAAQFAARPDQVPGASPQDGETPLLTKRRSSALCSARRTRRCRARRKGRAPRRCRSIRSGSRCSKSCMMPCGNFRRSRRAYGSRPAMPRSTRHSSRRISRTLSRARNSPSMKRARSSFDGMIPANRPADAHDVLGTFRLVSNPEEMKRLPKNAEIFLDVAATAPHHHGRTCREVTGRIQGTPQQGRRLSFCSARRCAWHSDGGFPHISAPLRAAASRDLHDVPRLRRCIPSWTAMAASRG